MEKKKIIKIIILSILIIIVMFLALTARKMLIIRELNEKVAKYVNNTNHYERIINNSLNT